jgi:flavin-dependent dehydrogenase
MNMLDTIIVGGGPAGASAACRLASGSREVVLLERSEEPHDKVCGEFISIETQHILHRLGVDLAALGAVPVDTVAIHVARQRAVASLPFRAMSVSRRRLDEALLLRSRIAGAVVRRGAVVQSVEREDGQWIVRCDGDEVLRCRNLVLATGKLRLRGTSDNRDGGLVGLKIHLRLSPAARRALERRVELVMLDRSYVGVELVEGGVANLCLVMIRELAAQIGSGWPALRTHLTSVSERLATLLEGAEPLFDKPLAVVCPSAGYLDDEVAPEAFRVGDRLAHIPPFTGDGLAIAVSSGVIAGDHILRGRSPGEYLNVARSLVSGPIRIASAVSRLAAHRSGRALIIGGAMLVPGLVGAVVRRTRLPALPIVGQDVSYAPIHA